MKQQQTGTVVESYMIRYEVDEEGFRGRVGQGRLNGKALHRGETSGWVLLGKGENCGCCTTVSAGLGHEPGAPAAPGPWLSESVLCCPLEAAWLWARACETKPGRAANHARV